MKKKDVSGGVNVVRDKFKAAIIAAGGGKKGDSETQVIRSPKSSSAAQLYMRRIALHYSYPAHFYELWRCANFSHRRRIHFVSLILFIGHRESP
jgi:hypothetical protein